ncbi:MAG: hypothetical protein R3E36_10210 [Nitrosomonas sp.]|nr:hypothetical protein [Nitrosomonas sp.]
MTTSAADNGGDSYTLVKAVHTAGGIPPDCPWPTGNSADDGQRPGAH